MTLVLWQAVVTATGTPAYIIPTPFEVARAFVRSWTLLWSSSLSTITAVLLGFACATVVSVPLAVCVVAFPLFQKSVYPQIVGFQGLPKVALAPMLIVWLGYGSLPAIAMALLIAFFPILIDTVAGLRAIDPAFIELSRSMGASKRQIYSRIIIPNALPQIFAGLKVGMSMALTGVIVAELVAGSRGLGYLITNGDSQLQIPLVFAAFVWLAILSVVLIGLVDLAERVAVPWAKQRRE